MNDAEALWNLVDRGYKMMLLAGYRITEHDPEHNNPIIAWMADAREALKARPEAQARDSIIEECADLLDAIYSQGPQRGTVVWGQAWGSGVLDGAAAIRSLKRPTMNEG